MKPTTENLEKILFEEERKKVRADTRKRWEHIRREKKEREEMLSGPTEYINTLRKAKVSIPLTFISKETTPTSKFEEAEAKSMGRLENHYLGIMHGLYLRLSAIALLGVLYVI